MSWKRWQCANEALFQALATSADRGKLQEDCAKQRERRRWQMKFTGGGCKVKRTKIPHEVVNAELTLETLGIARAVKSRIYFPGNVNFRFENVNFSFSNGSKSK